MHKLTSRQRVVLDYIEASIVDRGYPPTLREIGNHLAIRSTNGVNDHLRALEKKGYLSREDMKSRALRPTRMSSPADDLVAVPIVGRVAAGNLSEAIEEAEEHVRVDRLLIGSTAGDQVFGLRVTGDSMIEAGINDGDYVFVRKQITANRGQIVIALVGEEATCKYYFPGPGHVRLQPANQEMAPILVMQNDWRESSILGVVIGRYRRLR